MFRRNQEKEQVKRTKLFSMWLILLLLMSMVLGSIIFMAPSAQGTTSGNITPSTALYGDGITVNSAYISGNNPWGTFGSRCAFMSFDISSIGTGMTLSNVDVHVYINYLTASGSLTVNATTAFGGNVLGSGNAGLTNAQMSSISPAGSKVGTVPITGEGAWNSGSITNVATWQTQYDNNGTIYIGLSQFDFAGTSSSAGIIINTMYIVVTYSGGAPPVTWAPTITSTPTLTSLTGVPWSYHITTNETSTYEIGTPSGYPATTWGNYSVTADTFIKYQFPDDNFGGEDNLVTDSTAPGTNPYSITMLQWENLPAGLTINDATVNLYRFLQIEGSSTTHRMSVIKCDAIWNESTVTFNNHPGFTSSYYDDRGNGTGWFQLNDPRLLTYVQDQYTAWGKVSIALLSWTTDATGIGDLFYSKEALYGGLPFASPNITIESQTSNNFILDGSYLNATFTVPGSYNVSINVTSVAGGGVAYDNFTVTVIAPYAPTLLNPPALEWYSGVQVFNLTVGQFYSWTPLWGENVTYASYPSASFTIPSWMTWNGTTLSGTGTTALGGFFNMTVTSNNGTLTANYQWYYLCFANWVPTITGYLPWIGYEGVPISYQLTANETVTWALTQYIVWMHLSSSGLFTGTPTNTTGYINITATNSQGGVAYKEYVFVGLTIDHSVYVNSPPGYETTGDSFSFVPFRRITLQLLDAVDPYGDSLTLYGTPNGTVVTKPDWMTWSGTTLGGTAHTGYFLVSMEMSGVTSSWYMGVTPAISQPAISPLWFSMIPIFMLVGVVAVCSFTREGLSGTIFMGTTAIGVAVLIFADVLPWWSVFISGTIIALMLFRRSRL